jgi:hypothetical protein
MKIQINWTESLNVLLLETVMQHGAHLCKHGERETKWNQVNVSFFGSAEGKKLKALHFKANNFRMIEDKFKVLVSDFVNFKTQGNTSNKPGEVTVLFTMIKQIVEEIEAFEAEKAAPKERKRKHERIEADLLSPHTEEAKVESDVIEEVKTSKTPKKSPITTEMNFLQRVFENDDKPSHIEREANTLMSAWLSKNPSTIESFFVKAGVKVDDVTKQLFEEIAMSDIVELYCCPGKKFCQEYFCSNMQVLGFKMLHCLKIYKSLEAMRNETN